MRKINTIPHERCYDDIKKRYLTYPRMICKDVLKEEGTEPGRISRRKPGKERGKHKSHKGRNTGKACG